jgi:hypothetical protein
VDIKPGGATSVGRSKLQWQNGMNQDMKTVEVKNRKNAALARGECTQLLKVKGCRADDDDDGNAGGVHGMVWSATIPLAFQSNALYSAPTFPC